MKSVGLLLFIIERWIFAPSTSSRRTLISHSLVYKVLLVVFFTTFAFEHYQVHQKSSCYWLKRRFFGWVWVWNEKFTLLHLEQWLGVSLVMHKTFRVGRLCEYVCYSQQPVWACSVERLNAQIKSENIWIQWVFE